MAVTPHRSFASGLRSGDDGLEQHKGPVGWTRPGPLTPLPGTIPIVSPRFGGGAIDAPATSRRGLGAYAHWWGCEMTLLSLPAWVDRLVNVIRLCRFHRHRGLAREFRKMERKERANHRPFSGAR